MPKPDYTVLEFPPPPEGRPYVVINMVMSVDGKVVVDGTEQGLGSKVDQRLMRELRVHADVVLNGANTLRASGSSSRLGDPLLEQVRAARGREGLPIAATITATADLPLDRIFFTASDFDAVVYIARGAPAAKIAAVRATGRQVVILPKRNDLAAMLRHMRDDLGASLLLCEGGPMVNAGLFAIGAVDELFMTIGPRIVAGRDTLTPVEGERPFTRRTMKQLELVSAVPNEETGELYCRYRVRR
ncbi:dihydrofolate reductase family protein [Tepidiforma flava]|uniref:Dihydrofolate reductase family protein n=1 Tax=Tepidiforma flava TaxID=3004094 RepID=A0ABY7M7L7_9CHLR|nr:dihydrofolate reductase family protein [Tepidiforma flava]WBL36530.1 dihydrofolate reductase family protein [Tepidiforma flava]